MPDKFLGVYPPRFGFYSVSFLCEAIKFLPLQFLLSSWYGRWDFWLFCVTMHQMHDKERQYYFLTGLHSLQYVLMFSINLQKNTSHMLFWRLSGPNQHSQNCSERISYGKQTNPLSSVRKYCRNRKPTLEPIWLSVYTATRSNLVKMNLVKRFPLIKI